MPYIFKLLEINNSLLDKKEFPYLCASTDSIRYFYKHDSKRTRVFLPTRMASTRGYMADVST